MDIGKSLKKNLPYFVLSLAVASADQAVKSRAEKHPGDFREVIRNSGFAGERLKERPDIVRKTAFVLTAFGILRIPFMPDVLPGERTVKAGWSILMGGALSNTIDRVRKHYVVDYIPIGKYVYNLGDFAIYAGMAATAAGTLADSLSERISGSYLKKG